MRSLYSRIGQYITTSADQLHESTRNDLMAAMRGEAFATRKYIAYANAARAQGNMQLAQLFEETAKVESSEHFAEYAKLYGLVGSDADNLRDAIKGENYETTDMYQDMAHRAEVVGDKEAARRFKEVGADEAKHRDAFKAALAKLEEK